MRFFILLLSDIHIDTGTEDVLDRGSEIAALVRGSEEPWDLGVLAMTGDLANTGAAEQIATGFSWMQSIRQAIVSDPSSECDIWTIAAPGNHDCDFSEERPLRRVAVESLRNSMEVNPEAELITECLAPLAGFLSARASFAVPTHEPNELVAIYTHALSDLVIEAVCLNTAWLSQRQEAAGTSYFPADLLPRFNNGPALRIAVLHHPLNWFHPDSARVVRGWLDEHCDIVLTGHEHAHTARAQILTGKRSNLLVEAAALRSHGSEESEVVWVGVDTNAAQASVYRAAWNGNAYSVSSTTELPIPLSRSKGRSGFLLSEEFDTFLHDPGVNLRHPEKNQLTLEDVFVVPDFRKVDVISRDGGLLRGEEVFDRCLADKLVLIVGADQCGKSTYAKMLFRHAHSSGRVPVLLRGETVRRLDVKSAVRLLYRQFEAQYSVDSREHYQQLNSDDRVVIIDDFHLAPTDSSHIADLMEALGRFANNVICLSNDIDQQVSDLVMIRDAPELRAETLSLRMLPLGHVRRDELIERWLSMESKHARDSASLARAVEDAERRINTVIGRNFIPAYPIFLLSMLQGLGTMESAEVNVSSYGYFYDILIRKALAEGAGRRQYDVRIGYLRSLAHAMFSEDKQALSAEEIARVLRAYEADVDIRLRAEQLHNELISCGVLRMNGDEIGFKYPFLRYYFIASHFSEHMQADSVRAEIVRLANDMSDESANILLFLAHLTKDSFLLNAMTTAAREQFSSVPDATLSGMLLDGKPAQGELAFSLDDKPVREARRELLAKRDELDLYQQEGSPASEEVADSSADDDELREAYESGQRYVAQFSSAHRSVQILGQVLKNFPGTLSGTSKLEIASAGLGLSKRALGSALELVGAGGSVLLDIIRTALRDEHPKLDAVALEQRARASLFGLVHSLVVSSVQRTAFALGSPDLDLTYQKLFSADEASILDKLVRLGIRLDQMQDQFPEAEVRQFASELKSDPLALAVLKQLVVTHLYVFPSDRVMRERLCAKLGIDFSTARALNPRTKLIQRRT